MLKAVLDTNIFVSSIFWKKGNPHRVVDLALNKTIDVFVSTEILQELENVLRYYFKEPDEMIHRQISLILEYATIIKPSRKLDIVKADPADNKIMECALSCGADYVVTGDKHLLDLIEYSGTKIITARELLDILEKQKAFR